MDCKTFAGDSVDSSFPDLTASLNDNLYAFVVASNVMASASLLPKPKTNRSLPSLAEDTCESSPPFTFCSTKILNNSFNSLILVSASYSPPNKVTGPTPGQALEVTSRRPL